MVFVCSHCWPQTLDFLPSLCLRVARIKGTVLSPGATGLLRNLILLLWTTVFGVATTTLVRATVADYIYGRPPTSSGLLPSPAVCGLRRYRGTGGHRPCWVRFSRMQLSYSHPHSCELAHQCIGLVSPDDMLIHVASGKANTSLLFIYLLISPSFGLSVPSRGSAQHLGYGNIYGNILDKLG